jgi:putative ABC transport system permease protein
MAIPISYNIRSLAVRRTTTLMTALGVALTVAVLAAALALAHGLQTTFESSGHPLNLLVLRKGATAELSSAMTREVFRDLLFKPGIARSPGNGDPMASLELITTINLPNRQGSTGTVVRGLQPVGIELRSVRLRSGRWFQAGKREVVVGKYIAKRCAEAHVGGRLRFGKGEWEVVGVMDGGESVVSSEIFGDLNQVSSDFNRIAALNSVLLRADAASSVPALRDSLNHDRRLNAFAQTERKYYDRQTATGAPIQRLGILVSVIMAVGSAFTAMNTMYAAVARRAADIGTLRVLGFSRSSILLSFMIESLVVGALGGIIGCLIVLPLHNVTTGIGNFATVSEIAVNFRVGPAVMLAGFAFALLMGAAGGVLPARMAARRDILTALREG